MACKLSWAEQVELEEIENTCKDCKDCKDDNVTITYNGSDLSKGITCFVIASVVHVECNGVDVAYRGVYDEKARFRVQAPCAPKRVKECKIKYRPNKPVCRKGRGCVNRTCTFNHPHLQARD
jgi:hypothetical protein